MTRANMLTLGAGLFAMLGSSPVQAREELASIAKDDWVMVGVGVMVGPTYSGSDESEVFVGGAVMGRIGGFRVSPRVAGAAVDLIRDDDAPVEFTLGPVIRSRFDRTGSSLKNSVVESLGKLDTAIEVGANVGVGFKKILHPYDRIEVGMDVRKDIAGAHKGVVVSPSVTYQTPLSKGAAVSLMASADYWTGKTSRYYWAVSAAQSAASGLPEYKASDGFNSVSLLTIAIVDLDGNLMNGGAAIAAGGGYQRLTGSGKNSPITRLQGDADQWYGGIGVTYTFY